MLLLVLNIKTSKVMTNNLKLSFKKLTLVSTFVIGGFISFSQNNSGELLSPKSLEEKIYENSKNNKDIYDGIYSHFNLGIDNTSATISIEEMISELKKNKEFSNCYLENEKLVVISPRQHDSSDFVGIIKSSLYRNQFKLTELSETFYK